MKEFTGQDWPFEAIDAQKKATEDDKVLVFLAGEQPDVDSIQEIVTSLSFLLKFGRPFETLYALVQRRPDRSIPVFEWEVPFRHRVFSVSKHRLDLLRLLLEQCDSLCYELHYANEGERVTETNFDQYEQGTLNTALEQALRERGWTEKKTVPKGCASHYVSIEDWLERKKNPRKGPFHRSADRWWTELRRIWDKKRR